MNPFPVLCLRICEREEVAKHRLLNRGQSFEASTLENTVVFFLSL